MEPSEWEAQKKKLLSIPCSMTEAPAADWWKLAFNKRQAVLQQHHSLSRTALQWAMEVAQMRDIIESLNPNSPKLQPAALSTELLKMGLQQSVRGGKTSAEDEDEGSLSAGLISCALNVHRHILSEPRLVELLMDLEHRFGTGSPFHKLSKLNILATKPTSAKNRVWVMESLHDQIMYDAIKHTEVTKGLLQGDKHHCGLVQLFEGKWKVSWPWVFYFTFRD